MTPALNAPSRVTRRHWLAFALCSLALGACGGDGGGPATAPPPTSGPAPAPPPPAPAAAPRVLQFEISAGAAFVGESVELRVGFEGQQARIDPDLGSVTNGALVRVPPLASDREFRLVVSSPGHADAEQVQRVTVRFRDRHRTLPQAWQAADASASLAANGSVWLLGGDLPGQPGTRIDRYDPATGSLTTVGALREARAQPMVATLSDGSLLVVDGVLDAYSAGNAELVDGATGRSEPAGRLHTPRSGAAVLALPGGRVLVVGGLRSEGGRIEAIAGAELWDPATRQFRPLAASLATPRAGAQMIGLADGRVLVVGGYGGGADAPLAELWDPATERFAPVNTALPSRLGMALVRGPDGRAWVMGGRPLDSVSAPATASVLRFDPVTATFEELAPMATARTHHRALMLPNGEALVIGGLRDGGSGGTAERYDARAGGVAIAALDGDRIGHALVRLPSGRVLIAGGQDPAGPVRGSVLIYE